MKFCNEPGPYSAHCTELPLHRWSCYDASEDVSWNDRSPESWQTEAPHLCEDPACAGRQYEKMLDLDRPLEERKADFDRVQAAAPIVTRGPKPPHDKPYDQKYRGDWYFCTANSECPVDEHQPSTLEHRPVPGDDFMPSWWCGGCTECDRVTCPTICLACSYEEVGEGVRGPVKWPCEFAEEEAKTDG